MSQTTVSRPTVSQSTAERRFLILSAPGRPGGNTETLARRAVDRLPADVARTWLDLGAVPLPPFHDQRHDPQARRVPNAGEQLLIDATVECTDLVLVSPVYWGSLAAPAKLYLDHVVMWVRQPGVELRARMRGKTLWGVGVLSGPGHDDARPMVDMLESAADYLDMRFGGALIGVGDRPGDVLADQDAMTRALTFFG